jgi:hypothetical protein
MDLTETPQEQAACVLGVSRVLIHRTPASEIAEFNVQNFDVGKLGEELAILMLCDIVVDVPFGRDEEEKGTRLRARALGFLTELVGTHARHELTQEDAAHIQRMMSVEGRPVEEVRKHFLPQ